MKAVFGGAIAVVLLGIYVHLLWVAGQIVHCTTTTGCTKPTAADFNSVMAASLNIISGLVSALVIAELAVTKPGDAPAARVLSANASTLAQTVLKYVTGFYVLVWLVAGLVAFMTGMHHPDALPALTNVGQAWLGLAVAAAYAYFGLERS